MTKEKPHISVCICTYKRPALLRRLLEEVGRQETGGLFTYSIVVAEMTSHNLPRRWCRSLQPDRIFPSPDEYHFLVSGEIFRQARGVSVARR